ncbi:MAG: hypothetical protein H8E66_30545 [Planctomycetes bacterium]|nr:hypothetical protein [Planctomycetota bacterium]
MTKSMCKNNNFVMFQNPGVTDFHALFLVGFTDKAGDPDTIGMFGSGFKLAITAALRQGITVIVFLGREKVTFTTAAIQVKGEEVEQLVFVREQPDGTVESNATNLTLGYGAKDWKTCWGVFRELLANCRDADPHGYEVVAGVEPQGRDGYTRVFVDAKDEVMEIYRNLDCYFKEERNAMFACDEGRVYPKCAQEGQTNFYCKGMFVLTTRDTSLFDLDLYHMPINESRDASMDRLLTYVLRLFDSCPPDMKTEIIRYAIDKNQEGLHTLENSLYWSQTRRPHAWVDAFRRAFPDHVLCSFSDVEFQSMQRLGRKAVRVTREFHRLLSSHGVQTAKQVLRDEEEEQREMFEPDGILKENFEQAFEKIGDSLPEVNRLDINFVRLPASDRNVSFVTCSRARGEYQFSETLLKSGSKAVSLAIIDALAQTKSVSGKCDLDYERELVQMVMECIEK